MAGFGERIRTLREERGWKQEDLARAAKVSRDTVFRAERSEDVRVNSLYKLAAALGIPIGTLLGAQGRAQVSKRDREAATLLGGLTDEQHEYVVRLLRTFAHEEAGPETEAE